MTLFMALKLLIVLSIVLTIFALALKAKGPDWLYLVHNPGIALRCFTAMYIVVPAVALVMVLALELHPAVEVAIFALALAPLPPLGTIKQIKTSNNADLVTGILIGSAFAALVFAPAWIALVHVIMPGVVGIMPGQIVMPLVVTIAVPLLVGRLANALVPPVPAQRISAFLSKAAFLLLAVCALALLVILAKPLWSLVGGGTLIAIIAFILMGLVAGHFLAGSPQRASILAWACATRHPGVAIAIATAALPDEPEAPAAIILFLLVNSIVGLPMLRRIDAIAGQHQTAE